MDCPRRAGSASLLRGTGMYSTPRFDCDCQSVAGIKGHELKASVGISVLTAKPGCRARRRFQVIIAPLPRRQLYRPSSRPVVGDRRRSRSARRPRALLRHRLSPDIGLRQCLVAISAIGFFVPRP